MIVELIAAISADGKIAQEKDQSSIEWTGAEDKRFFVSKTKAAGVMIMGRSTFETIGRPLPGRLIIVMTRDSSKFGSLPDQVEYSSDSPQQILKQLQDRGFEKVVIAGGAKIYSLFLQEKLVADLFLTIEPILFGGGVPLLSEATPINLELVESDRLGEHGVLLHYKVL